MIEPNMRQRAISLIRSMIDEHIITSHDLTQFITDSSDSCDPEYVRQEMETWYRTLGIEALLHREFTLTRPSFTKEELAEAYEREEIILCVPRGVNRHQLGSLFNLPSWALDDELVADATEVEDFWFKTKRSFVPDHLNKTGIEVQRIFEGEGKLGISLSRYMTFVARMRYLTGKTPDAKHWVWLTRGRYDLKGMLVAGFDTNLKFSVQAWLPHFQGALCGSRYVSIADHL